MEKFIDIKGYEGFYQISNFGRVKSLKRNFKIRYGFRTQDEMIMTPGKKDNDYLFVYLCKSGVKRAFYIHRLVAIHFIPNPENKKEVNHLYSNKEDNRVDVLEWSTRSENLVHSYKNGTRQALIGTKHSVAKLNERQVKQIKSRYAKGRVSFRSLASEYGVHHSIIDGIMKGKRWPHVK